MTEFMGKQLKNPLLASSCIITENEENILRLAAHGVQGAILKSCADYQRGEVNSGRCFAKDNVGYTYASSPFEKEIMMLEECRSLLQSLRPKTDMLLIPSVTACSLMPEDWMPVCKELGLEGADAIQLDFFYMGSLLGTAGFAEKLVSLLRKLISELEIPVMPKLNVNLPKDYIIPLLVEAGVEYVSLLDSVRSPYLEKTEQGYQVSKRLDATTTSCFGGWQLPLTLGYTYTAAQQGLKVCAGGGVTCAEDVKKLLAAGAVTVQSATFLTQSPERAEILFPKSETN